MIAMGILDFLSLPKKKPTGQEVEDSREKVHDIKNDLQVKLFKIQKQIDEKNKQTTIDLDNISKQIGDVANSISVATGRVK